MIPRRLRVRTLLLFQSTPFGWRCWTSLVSVATLPSDLTFNKSPTRIRTKVPTRLSRKIGLLHYERSVLWSIPTVRPQTPDVHTKNSILNSTVVERRRVWPHPSVRSDWDCQIHINTSSLLLRTSNPMTTDSSLSKIFRSHILITLPSIPSDPCTTVSTPGSLPKSQ